jgi:hypothetical protein
MAVYFPDRPRTGVLKEELIGPEGSRHVERPQKAVLWRWQCCGMYCCVTGQVVLGFLKDGSSFFFRVKTCFLLDYTILEIKVL